MSAVSLCTNELTNKPSEFYESLCFPQCRVGDIYLDSLTNLGTRHSKAYAHYSTVLRIRIAKSFDVLLLELELEKI